MFETADRVFFLSINDDKLTERAGDIHRGVQGNARTRGIHAEIHDRRANSRARENNSRVRHTSWHLMHSTSAVHYVTLILLLLRVPTPARAICARETARVRDNSNCFELLRGKEKKEAR